MNLILKKLLLKNFKKIKNQTYEFTDFDLLVGQNNSGKSTVLQAIAIWQYCVDEFGRRPNKTGNSGIQIVLPNFTALPLPEFNLLWNDKIDRKYANGGKKQEFILVEIDLEWRNADGETTQFGVHLRYQTPQSAYAIPAEGWKYFHELKTKNNLPRIVYVPPFSGLDTSEIWYDDSVLKRNVGKAQPGSVLRNLLYRVVDKTKNVNGKILPVPIKENTDWQEISRVVKEWFGVQLNPPIYERGGTAIDIAVTYKVNGGKEFDIIAGGSGFHQVLTLLAFYYGFEGLTTILFDEPDAHMHVNLQRKVISYFKQKKNVQFITATHAEEFIKGVGIHGIISVLSNHHKRASSLPDVITALSDIDNLTVVETSQSPFVLYLEGEDDERILAAWASVLKKSDVLFRYHTYIMGGTTKKDMRDLADKHFRGLKQINPIVNRVMLFDYDSEETAFNPPVDNPVLYEWKRKNIENYLLVPEAWKRAILDKLNLTESNHISQPFEKIVDEFFIEQNLTLPQRANWETVKANIFEEVNGKKILFEREEALFHRIKNASELIVDRATVANNMIPFEIHIDVKRFFENLENKIT